MTNRHLCSLLALAAIAGGCRETAQQSPTEAAELNTDALFVWPDNLKVLGRYPSPESDCHRIGETPSTSNFLDDSAVLVGCPSASEAHALGGRVVGIVSGVTLVSIPAEQAAKTVGEGLPEGDALVAGTNYHATAEIPCAGLGAGISACKAGVTRGPEQIAVEVSLPNGRTRSLLFDGKGKFVTISTAQSDGTAAWKIDSRREGDWTVIKAGPETYRVPDAFVLGG